MQLRKHLTAIKVGVSCNCKKGCVTRRSRCCKNDLKCSIYCRNADYDCGNLKPLTERTTMVLGHLEGNKGGQSTGETQAPVPALVVARDEQSQRKVQTGR